MIQENKKQKVGSFSKILLGFIGAALLFFSVPLFVNAEAGDPVTDPNFQLAPTKGSCDKNAQGVEECGWSDFIKLINRIMKFAVFISASVGVLMFAYAGFLYLTAFGEMGKVEQAHKIFSTTITGIIIIMLAWLIVATILKTLEVMPEFTILQDSGSNVPPVTLPSDGSTSSPIPDNAV
ncbi:MAG: hypothetical protein V4469_02890 [Patescibacteria group bacterium]